MILKSLQLKLNNRLFDLSTPLVMGIVNVTPDSFYKGNRFMTDRSVLNAVERMMSENVDIIDIGGYSTRPGANFISQDEEIKRVSEGIEVILKKYPEAIISVDTFRSAVVRHVVKEFEIAMINDIGGGTLDDLMFETIANLELAYILMHTKGSPQLMQSNTQYENVVSEVLLFLEKRLAQLHLLGVKDVIIDPGFGFAKTQEQNYQLLNKLHYLKELQVPILVGLSRKSMLYNLLETDAAGALNATVGANMLALMGGASILRVHDVKEAKQAVSIFMEFRNQEVSCN
ncbi:MAG: dihydropteroate synthase [Paludibacter sp.]